MADIALSARIASAIPKAVTASTIALGFDRSIGRTAAIDP
jgi:hypothetical protein